MRKVRIKVGASIMQDFGFGRWPACYPPKSLLERDFDENMVFIGEYKQQTDSWDCKADGFGFMRGDEGEYGNGSIFVRGFESVEILPDDTPVFRIPKYPSREDFVGPV